MLLEEQVTPGAFLPIAFTRKGREFIIRLSYFQLLTLIRDDAALTAQTHMQFQWLRETKDILEAY